MFRKIVMAALLGVLGTATFASTASANERDFGRIERRGDFDRREGFRAERRERFESVWRGPLALRHRDLRTQPYRAW